jgi:putative membrane protein
MQNKQTSRATETRVAEQKTANPLLDWFVRAVKGFVIGFGAITPGLSGGLLMVVLGIYEPLMRFLGNIKDKFLKNVLFFIPVGVGGVAGVVIFSKLVSYTFENYKAPFIWLFLGFIAGTFPSLLKTAGKNGRKSYHYAILIGLAVLTFLLMRWMETISNVTLPQTLASWLLAGLLIGLGLVVPGMSPSNFLIYIGLYKPMSDGIGALNLGIILPLIGGVLISVLLLAKAVNWMFDKAYGVMYHVILGIVVGSSAAIALIHGQASGTTIVICAVCFVIGALASYVLAKLDEKFPHESLF